MIYVMSGGTKLFAAIGVTYPAGSTLTCTNGTTTLKAKTATGQWVFAIPKAGTWTVTASDGTNTKSQSVSITTEGQFESVELSYALVLFDGGAKVSWAARSSRPTASIGSTLKAVAQNASSNVVSIITTTNKITVTDYKTLYFNVTDLKGSRASVGLTSSTTAGDIMNGLGQVASGVKAYTSVGNTGTVSVDVSSLTGDYYVYMGTGGYGEMLIEADESWLE